jgi:hypothetical protein
MASLPGPAEPEPDMEFDLTLASCCQREIRDRRIKQGRLDVVRAGMPAAVFPRPPARARASSGSSHPALLPSEARWASARMLGQPRASLRRPGRGARRRPGSARTVRCPGKDGCRTA